MKEKHEILIQDCDTGQETTTAADNWETRYLRLTADFDNYRKRTELERLEQTKRIKIEVLRSTLPVYDDFHHLLDHVEDEENLLAGVQSLQKSWQQWMQQHELTSLGEIGEDFDYSKHEAVLQEPVKHPSMDGKVTGIIKMGYMHKDLVLRHARVAVGRYQDLPAIRNNQEEADIHDI